MNQFKIVTLFLLITSISAQAGKYSVIGVDDDNQVESFFVSIQQDIKANDAISLSEKVIYPFRIYSEKETIKLHSKQQFIESYSQFMTNTLKAALLCQTTDDLRANSGGLRAARGAIWMNSVFIGKPGTLDRERHKKGLDRHMWQLKVRNFDNGQMATLVVQDCKKRMKSESKD